MRAIVLILLPALLLAGCGQKGALYQPGQAPNTKRHHVSMADDMTAPAAGSADDTAASGAAAASGPTPSTTPLPAAASGASTGTP